MNNKLISHEALTTLCDLVDKAIIGLNQEKQITIFNAAAERMFGLATPEVLHTALTDHTALQSLIALGDWVLTTGESAQQEITFANGRTRWVEIVPVLDSNSGGGTFKLAARKETIRDAADPVREIVHDLKVRIASAKGFIDLIEAAGELNAQQQKFAQRAQLSLVSMLSQVHEVLDMAWLDSGGTLERVTTNLNELVERAVMHLEGYAYNANVEIMLDLPPEGCFISGDERRLGSAISNLIGNAIKYSPNGGPVAVSVEVQPHAVTLRVRDHGVGIPAEHIPHLFKRFYRVRTRETQRIEGSGLGLAITKAIIEKHGGEVMVESEVGQGSMFGFTLPTP